MLTKMEDDREIAEFENAVSLTGFGRYNIGLLCVCGICLTGVSVELQSMAYILPAAQCDLNLTLWQKSIISSISYLAVVLSSVMWGLIGDTVGRRKIIIVTSYLGCLFGFASSVVSNVSLFITLRFLSGFCISCPSSVVVPYIGEFHSDKYRTKILSWIGTFLVLGLIVLPGMSWIILPMNWRLYVPLLDITIRPWRLLIIMCSAPIFIATSFLLRYPESPKFLWATGQTQQALVILRNMYATNNIKDDSTYPVTSLSVKNLQYERVRNTKDAVPKSLKKMCTLIRDQVVPLFRMPFLPNITLTYLLMFGIFAGSNGLFMWAPTILNDLTNYVALFPNEPISICKTLEYSDMNVNASIANVNVLEGCSDDVDENVFLITISLGLVFTVIFSTIGFIANKIGKKLLVVSILLILGIAATLVGFVQSYLFIVILVGIFLIGTPGSIFIVSIIIDLIPTQYRALAVAMSQMIGRIGAVIGSNTAGYLLKYYCSYAFLIYAANFFAMVVFALLIPLPLFPKRRTK